MAYISIDLTEKQKEVARQIVLRENEVHAYQTNIDNYTAMVSGYVMGEWPEEIIQFKGVPAEAMPHGLSDEIEDAVMRYNFRDRILYLIRTEKREQHVAQNFLDVLKSQFPSDQLEAAVLEAKAEIDAQIAAAKAKLNA